MNILKTISKLSDLNNELDDMEFHIFHLKVENGIFQLENDLEEMDKYDMVVSNIRNIFKQSSIITDEWIFKKNEINVLKNEYGISDLEEEYDRRYLHFKDGKKYLDSLYEKEFDILADKLAAFHL